jgi:YARHG domain
MTKLTVAVLTVLALSGAAYGGDNGCDGLWIERNSYYKEAGYCFQTLRAIEVFGNDGCRTSNQAALYLPNAVRARIAAIVRMERRFACN